MISNCCYNTTEPSYGLKMSIKHSSMKVYLIDTGLLVTHVLSDQKNISNEIFKSIIFDKLQINEGMIIENFVSQTLKSLGYHLYFFSNKLNKDDKRNTEIDFLIQGNNINPIEVKSGRSDAHPSLDKFNKKFKNKLGQKYIICRSNLKVDNDYIYLPFYMALCL
jgi:hypothetical protein